ncbi:hypothetical protein TorRG33x02_087770 [Trema orientale]|uniref:Uncharacterized protein n=1 Tax=Trema orientale TaxID=63057 RepID=A0A2P5FBV6_TREOI|nr:hypothetical protein TorRG33x02_087770 [Trema orientale]
MKREGRQHGMVRTYEILPSPLRPETRFVNRLTESPATAGLFTPVSSKFTGKCGKPRCSGCHLHPARKSKAKAKTRGNRKLKSKDVVSNHRLLTWLTGSKFSGFSASRVLDRLSSYHAYDNEEEEEEEEEEEGEEVGYDVYDR